MELDDRAPLSHRDVLAEETETTEIKGDEEGTFRLWLKRRAVQTLAVVVVVVVIVVWLCLTNNLRWHGIDIDDANADVRIDYDCSSDFKSGVDDTIHRHSNLSQMSANSHVHTFNNHTGLAERKRRKSAKSSRRRHRRDYHQDAIMNEQKEPADDPLDYMWEPETYALTVESCFVQRRIYQGVFAHAQKFNFYHVTYKKCEPPVHRSCFKLPYAVKVGNKYHVQFERGCSDRAFEDCAYIYIAELGSDKEDYRSCYCTTNLCNGADRMTDRDWSKSSSFTASVSLATYFLFLTFS